MRTLASVLVSALILHYNDLMKIRDSIYISLMVIIIVLLVLILVYNIKIANFYHV